jgi:hypothetical protein
VREERTEMEEGREGRRVGRREGGRAGGREGRREGGRVGRREGGRAGGQDYLNMVKANPAFTR